MTTIPLRYLAEINPQTPELEAVTADTPVMFLPLETVWADGRADQTRTVPKRAVTSGYTRFRPGDVVCPKVTPTFQAGRSMIAQALGAGTTELHILRPRQDVDPRWVCYAVRSKHFLDEGVTAFQGVAGLQRVPAEYVASFRVADVSVDEQRRIADFLDDRVTRIDQIIAARTLQANLVEEAFLARMRAGVAGALNDDDTTTNSEIPWLERSHSSAVTVSMARVLTLQRGVDLTDQQRRPGDVPVVTTAGIVGQHDEAICQGPGVVIGRYGSVGNVHWVDEPFWPHNTTLYVKQTQGNDMRWIYYLLRSFPYAAMQARAAVPGINRNDLAVELVPWIPVPLQRRAVELLAADEHASKEHRAELEASVTLLTEFKQSLITTAVSGELDVSTTGSGIPG
ncbi:hypothetical protein GA707_19650 [Nostocoides sp. F2B08]|uniref:restriction endonuclease subunit S n=1 Tax=Nostocoides sp. F2B08 TaxID=2653936 RepID=UPI0012630AA9|nr:restriction endonuclease subunit S [Tetrasphaera sp. F2B08]KAB7740036.1 hypothetical protein GA707_19650 [Tetrasphaera sp. F2B08]